MDSWETYSLRQSRSRPAARNRNPSFSSTLLDAIYRSIDEGEDAHEDELVACKEAVQKKPSRVAGRLDDDNGATIRKAFEAERRTAYRSEKNFASVRRSYDYDGFQPRHTPAMAHSASTSSESSYGGFSSSEAESVYHGARPKPVRTCPAPAPADRNQNHHPAKHRQSFLKPFSHHQEHDEMSSYNKTKGKSRASPKKAKKQPVSPGARLAGFLNSLFTTAGTAKKAKLSSSFNGEDYLRSAAPASSTCSSASSYSRSCLSKTPSSRGKSVTGGAKRSVRFYPESVIVDEDCRPCGQKSLYEEEKVQITEKNERVEAAASRILNRYQTKTEILMRREALAVHKVIMSAGDDDDDAASDASSDLFELKNLGSIGVDRYREELPVYETTHLDTNRAIANGLIV